MHRLEDIHEDVDGCTHGDDDDDNTIHDLEAWARSLSGRVSSNQARWQVPSSMDSLSYHWYFDILSKSSSYFPGFAGESSERVFHSAKRLFLFHQLLEEEKHKTLDWKKESGQRSLATRRIQQGRTCQAKVRQKKKREKIQKFPMVENISLFTKERQTPLS